MSSLKVKLSDDLKTAMKDKDVPRRDILRALQAAIKQVEVDERKELDDAGVLKVLSAEAKRRREAMEAFHSGGRTEDAEKEHQELGMIEAYLPKQLSRDEVKAIAQAAIAETGVTSLKELGKVMPVIMGKVQGHADGRTVNEVVRELLS